MRPKGSHLSLNFVTGVFIKLELTKNKTTWSVCSLSLLRWLCSLCWKSSLLLYPVFQKTTLCGLLFAFASIFLTFLTFLYHLWWLADLTILQLQQLLCDCDTVTYYILLTVLYFHDFFLSLNRNGLESLGLWYLWKILFITIINQNKKIRVKVY